MNELAKALVKAQSAMNHAAKDAKNPHFKSSYSSLASVIDAVRPHLAGNGLAIVQKTHDAEGGVCVETVLIHESGQELSFGKLFVPASKQDSQGFGSALSYAKRYSIQTALCVASADDDGEAASRPKPFVPASTIDMDVAITKMLSAANMDDLKAVFAAEYKLASAEQKTALKAKYDEIKKEFE